MIVKPDKDEEAIARVKALLESAQASYDLVKYSRKVADKAIKEQRKITRDNLKEQLKELDSVWIPHEVELDDIQKAILSYDEYEKQAEYGVTSMSIPRYKKWVENNYEAPVRDSDKDLISRLDSVFGTAFHNYAEKILAKVLPDVDLEESIVAKVGEYEVGGTADIVDRRNGKARICDHKTTKVYSAGKALQGEIDKWVYQLSIYKHLLEVNGEEVEDFGTIYVWVTGWTPRDSEKTPKLYRVNIPLMDFKRTHNYIIRQIEGAKEKPEMDCEMWLCNYCDYQSVCPMANSGGFKDES